MKRLPWLKMRKKTAPELPYEPPIWFGPRSNGEGFWPMTKRDRIIRKTALQLAADHAKRIGMDRRDFLASAMGMCTTLYAINLVTGCGSDSSSNGNGGGGAGGSGGGAAGGAGGAGGSGGSGYCIPPEAMFDENAACTAIDSSGYFIFDVQTHWFKSEDLDNWKAYQDAFAGLFAVATEDAYINAMFCASNTSMAALTAWPGVSCTATRKIGCGLPLSNQNMNLSRQRINDLAGNTQRVVNHTQILPQDPSGIDVQLEIMEEVFCQEGVAAWKLYPGFKPGWKMDNPNFEKVVEKGAELGVNLFCIHKGLPIGTFFDTNNNYPDDVGPAALKFPDANFVIYHSAICAGSDTCGAAPPEGPYDENEANPRGVNALIRSVLDAGLGQGSNVFAETGTSFNNLRGDVNQAQHFFGKLMKHLGPDNVVWGTDSIINGTPQSQIDSFMALDIPQAMQDQYGYPPLDATNKAKILGLNAAGLYGVDVDAKRCQIETCQLTELKKQMDDELGPRRWAFDPPLGPKTYEEFYIEAENMKKIGRPG